MNRILVRIMMLAIWCFFAAYLAWGVLITPWTLFASVPILAGITASAILVDRLDEM